MIYYVFRCPRCGWQKKVTMTTGESISPVFDCPNCEGVRIVRENESPRPARDIPIIRNSREPWRK